MRVVEKTARTVDDAIDQAIAELGTSREEVDVEIIDQPSKGFFGLLGTKPARVKVTVRNTPSRKVRAIMTDILATMNLDAKMDINEKDDIISVNLKGGNLGILICRRGETLDALQYLINLSVNKNMENRKKFILDIEGYRRRREETLEKLAHKLADKARQRGRNIVLEPMNSLERRIIHTTLQERDDISTFSEGEEPYRKIIIAPKKQ